MHWRRRRLLPTRLMSNRNLFYATVATKTLLISSMFGESCVDRLKTFSIFEANRVHLMDIHTKVLHGDLFGRRQIKYQIISAATFVVKIVFIDTRLHSNGTWTKTIMLHYFFFFRDKLNPVYNVTPLRHERSLVKMRNSTINAVFIIQRVHVLISYQALLLLFSSSSSSLSLLMQSTGTVLFYAYRSIYQIIVRLLVSP